MLESEENFQSKEHNEQAKKKSTEGENMHLIEVYLVSRMQNELKNKSFWKKMQMA